MIITADKKRGVGIRLTERPVPIKHGLSKHPLYRVWVKIKERVYNPNHEAYHLYGGNGVTMCNEWKNNAVKFIEWALENGWQKGLQIDKDIIPEKIGISAKSYSPEMCSIVTQKENNRHTKYNRYIEFNGRRQTFIDWANELGIDQCTLWHRFEKGMTIEQAFLTPVNHSKNRYKNDSNSR